MGKKRELFGYVEDTLLNGIFRFDIELFFRHYIRSLNKESRHDYKLTRKMKRDYRAYYRSFGFRHIHLDWVKYIYGITGRYDRRYVPDDIFTKYIDYPYTTNRIAWQNKAYQPKILEGVTFPETIVKRENGFFLDRKDEIISLEQALALIREEEEVVLKPALGSAGLDIRFYRSSDLTEKVFSECGEDIIVQRLIEQSNLMKNFTDDCVNILKITSFYFHGEVHIVSARIWGGVSRNRTSNATGYMVAVNAEGELSACGFNNKGDRFTCTDDGIKFSDIKLDFYGECVDIIRYGHKKLLNFPFISWDFTQDKNGKTVLIEYNLKWHVLYDVQMLSGPAFGELTDEVLKEASANIHKPVPIRF